MTYVLITLIVVAVIMFISSFFIKDKFSDLENQIEQVSITMMQDAYQINKKLRILEEELLSENITQEVASTTESSPLIIQKVYHLNQQGFSIEDIAAQTNLNTHDIQTIIKNS